MENEEILAAMAAEDIDRALRRQRRRDKWTAEQRWAETIGEE